MLIAPDRKRRMSFEEKFYLGMIKWKPKRQKKSPSAVKGRGLKICSFIFSGFISVRV